LKRTAAFVIATGVLAVLIAAYVFVPFATDTWGPNSGFGPVSLYKVSLSFYIFGCGVVHGGYYTVNY
jgi:hypothetical protein